MSSPSCLRRAIHNLSLDQKAASSSLSLKSPSRSYQRRQDASRYRVFKRGHATYDSLVRGHHRRTLRLTLSEKTPPEPNRRRKAPGGYTRGEMKDALARENNRKVLMTRSDRKIDDIDPNATLTPQQRRQATLLKREVEQYYSDPLILANAVTKRLRVPDFQAAIALVRASEGIVIKNVVSWNHCIDWCMSQGETEKAWKLYNELKKRGHRPDSHTYTIMLRGLSHNAWKANSSQRAVSIYNSMFAPNSAVLPNTIHTNAVLNVCARARDMESMWAIAGRLPERGAGSPDRRTFTTIFNAIKEDATARVAELLKNANDLPKESDGEHIGLEERQKVIFEEALKDGRKLWADVNFRWRRADLVVDESLVCAMGRLILGCGTRQDIMEVFDLVDSTMNIRLAERGYKKGSGVNIDAIDETEQKEADAELSDTTTALTEPDGSSMPLAEEQVYAAPGHNTLALITEAATSAREVRFGRAYWHYLTTPNGPYQIKPDAANIISYLRMLRISRASKDALDVLSREWPDDVADKLYRRGTFVIAMSTCIRDKNNPEVFNTAGKLLSLMQNKLEEAKVGMYDKFAIAESDSNLTFKERRAAAKARMSDIDEVTFGEDEALAEVQRTKSGVESSTIDPKVLRMYIDLAVLKTPGWNEGVKDRDDADESFERDPMKNNTLRALRRLGPDMVNISRLMKMKLLEAEVASRPASEAQKKDLSRSAQRKISDRAGTRVAEKVEDMVELLRSIVSAYDKVLSVNDRFENEGRPKLKKELIDDYRNQKRKMSAFLSRIKDEVKKITRGSMEFAKWRNTSHDEGDEDNQDDETVLYKKRTETPKIARDVRRIYEDTDRDLGRVEQRSRRQKLERRIGVDRRMKTRLGIGQDPGVLDDDLSIRKREEVQERMRRRAFNISVGSGTGSRVGQAAADMANGGAVEAADVNEAIAR